MNPDHHRRVSEIFLGACELPPGERAQFLIAACGGDAALRHEVEDLLAHDEHADVLLDANEVHQRILSEAGTETTAEFPAGQPERIGSYRILGILGAGGQGVVYRAEQSRPRRPVALKVLRDTPRLGESGARRFEMEIQALAALRHSAIATVYEAGETEEGRRYFSMELVDGTPIDEYVRRESPTVAERLELFRRVCEGVQHAHDNGVVHRDLKPANILVDRDGMPHILDFGLVRWLDPRATCASTVDGPGHLLGSLRYMSPEQASGHASTSGVRTDVYALGVILYEMLTGRWPYGDAESLPEVVRAVCETRPVRPGAVVPQLKGDLETIVLTALEKDPACRCGSASALAEDVRRYLEKLPILASPPGRAYALKKTILRHPRIATALAAGLILGLVAAAASGAWHARRSAARITNARMEAARVLNLVDRAFLQFGVGEAEMLVAKHPHLPEARLVLAQARYKAARQFNGNDWVCVRILKTGISGESAGWAFGLLLAEIYDLGGNPEAKTLRAAANREAGDDSQSWYLRSLATFDAVEAKRSAKRAVELDASNWPAWARLYYVCLRLRDPAGAREAAHHLSEGIDPKWGAFEGHALTLERRYPEAIAAYERAHRRAAVTVGKYVALNHLCLGQYEQAVRDFDYLAVERSHDPYVYYKRATPLWITGRTKEAVGEYEHFRLLAGRTSLADARLYLVRQDLARQLEGQGDLDEAVDLRARAEQELRAARDSAPAASWLGRVLRCLAGEITPEELVASADRTDTARICEGYYYAAEACLLRGRFDAARAYYEACVTTDLVFDPDPFPPDPMNEFHLAKWRLATLVLAEGVAPGRIPGHSSPAHRGRS